MLIKFLLISFTILSQNDSFLKDQRRYKRFRTAEKEKLNYVQGLFRSKNIEFEKTKIFIRSFKQEEELELWAYSNKAKNYVLLKKYEICENSGDIGPKRERGDEQVPEGVYFIDRFNPYSNFYLSLGLNYPNKSDRVFGVKGNLGGDIFIHGSCVTIGCIPIEDEFIKELYLISVYMKNYGQNKIPVHLFPLHMNSKGMNILESEFEDQQEFWINLEKVYSSFEKEKVLKKIIINNSGKYIVSGT